MGEILQRGLTYLETERFGYRVTLQERLQMATDLNRDTGHVGDDLVSDPLVAR